MFFLNDAKPEPLTSGRCVASRASMLHACSCSSFAFNYFTNLIVSPTCTRPLQTHVLLGQTQCIWQAHILVALISLHHFNLIFTLHLLNIYIGQLADKVEEALKIGEGFEARFEDAKSTVNQISIDAITKCNAIAPELQKSVGETASTLRNEVSTQLNAIEKLATDLEDQTETAIKELRDEITTNVTSAIKDLTKVSLAQSDCKKTHKTVHVQRWS